MIRGIMDSKELQNCFSRLGLADAEAAELLSVDPRTVRRWKDQAVEIPGPVEQALRAWVRLEECGLAWRPDGIALGEDDPEKFSKQIAAHRNHAIELDAVIKRVKDRGGPAAPWEVDLERRCAMLGGIRISFYALRNGGFSPSTYSRKDGAPPDMVRDQSLIEDGYATIAREIASAGKGWADESRPRRKAVKKRAR